MTLSLLYKCVCVTMCCRLREIEFEMNIERAHFVWVTIWKFLEFRIHRIVISLMFERCHLIYSLFCFYHSFLLLLLKLLLDGFLCVCVSSGVSRLLSNTSTTHCSHIWSGAGSIIDMMTKSIMDVTDSCLLNIWCGCIFSLVHHMCLMLTNKMCTFCHHSGSFNWDFFLSPVG